MPPIHEFSTWEPLLRLMWAGNADRLAEPGGYVTGQIGRRSWSVPFHGLQPGQLRSVLAEDRQAQTEAVDRVRHALAQAGWQEIAFVAEISLAGRYVLSLRDPTPCLERDFGGAGSLLLAEGAIPEPWRHLPEPAPGIGPRTSGDLELLEQTLRERLPEAVGATDAQIAAAEARLGIPLPDELKTLYRVVRAEREDWEGDQQAIARICMATRAELLALSEVYVADASTRTRPWKFAATAVVQTGPDAAVQGLVGSPGWIVFGGNGGGDMLALDLTPGPHGHRGQIIMINHEDRVGAWLCADSLTAFITDTKPQDRTDAREPVQPPPVAHVNHMMHTSIEAAAHQGLEVLQIGAWYGEPFHLNALIGLPRLRTLTAYPGTLADPAEIAELTGLEYLSLSPQDWRALLDADAVPPSLAAAGIESMRSTQHPFEREALANEILALWKRPPIRRTVLEGQLEPL